MMIHGARLDGIVVATFLACMMSGCSNQNVTKWHAGQTGWGAGGKPWYVGRELGPYEFEPAPGADRALIFKMGDGIQGYAGDVAGEDTSRFDLFDVFIGEDMLATIEWCSGEDMHVQGGRHGFSVAVRSSVADHETVDCVRRNANRYFSVGYGNAHHATIERPFQNLQNKGR